MKRNINDKLIFKVVTTADRKTKVSQIDAKEYL